MMTSIIISDGLPENRNVTYLRIPGTESRRRGTSWRRLGNMDTLLPQLCPQVFHLFFSFAILRVQTCALREQLIKRTVRNDSLKITHSLLQSANLKVQGSRLGETIARRMIQNDRPLRFCDSEFGEVDRRNKYKTDNLE